MPGFGPKYFNCILCGTRTKPKNRKYVGKEIQKYLRKNFMIEAKTGDIICNKCTCSFYKANSSSFSNSKLKDSTDSAKVDLTPASPTPVRLHIQSAARSHAYCCLCRRPGPKLISVPSEVRFNFFLDQNVLLPAGCRCCPNHVNNQKIVGNFQFQSCQSILINSDDLEKLISKLRITAIHNSKTRIDFDQEDEMSDEDYINLTGLNKSDFREVCQYAVQVRNTPARTLRTSVGIFLMKLKSGLSNKLMSTLFNISKSSLRRAISSVRTVLLNNFVPEYLGFHHITREKIISDHTRPLADFLFGNSEKTRAILVLDGTYIYIQKSNNFQFQRRTYSVHKGRPLVKPMVICSTTGYFISILGPYFSDSKNNDAAILNHAMRKNVDTIRDWVHEEDVLVVDRGFRDSLELLEDLGIKARMPSFLRKGDKQLSCADANSSRLVSKVRWVIESANARIKKWKFLNSVLPTNQVRHIGDYVRIVCAISNRFSPPLSAATTEDENIAAKMLHLSNQVNNLQEKIIENGMDRQKIIWKTVDEDDLDDFPKLDEEDLSNITCGTYQLRLGPSYIKEHIDGDADLFIHREHSGLLQVKLQSRHVSSRKYTLWIEFTPSSIVATYCKCRAGARVVGVCSHVAAVLWYLGLSRHKEHQAYGVQDWGDSLSDAAIVDESDSDESVIEE